MIEYDTWRADPTPENLGKVVSALDPVINSEIQRFSGPKPLLRSRAKALTVKAIKTYDPMSGAQLRSWATTHMQQLARYGQRLRAVHAPEVAIRQAAEVNRVRMEMADTLGRDPEDEELADAVGISVKRIRDVRRMVKPTVAEGAMAEPADEDSVAGMPAISQPNKLSLAEELVYDSLTPRDRAIFDWKTGRKGKTLLSNQEIARRLGVTPALISQRSQLIARQIQQVMARESL